MGLTWDVSKVNSYEANYPDLVDADGRRKWNPITESIVWLTMFCGTPTITEANHEDVAQRFTVWQRINGSMLSNGYIVTLKDVRQHIGMHTNVSSKTEAAFLKEMGKQLWIEAKKEMRKTAS